MNVLGPVYIIDIIIPKIEEILDSIKENFILTNERNIKEDNENKCNNEGNYIFSF